MTYFPRWPDFNCPRLTKSATEPLLSCSRLLMMACLATAAKTAMPRQKPATKFGPMFLRICMKREGKSMNCTNMALTNSSMSHGNADKATGLTLKLKKAKKAGMKRIISCPNCLKPWNGMRVITKEQGLHVSVDP